MSPDNLQVPWNEVTWRCLRTHFGFLSEITPKPLHRVTVQPISVQRPYSYIRANTIKRFSVIKNVQTSSLPSLWSTRSEIAVGSMFWWSYITSQQRDFSVTNDFFDMTYWTKNVCVFTILSKSVSCCTSSTRL